MLHNDITARDELLHKHGSKKNSLVLFLEFIKTAILRLLMNINLFLKFMMELGWNVMEGLCACYSEGGMFTLPVKYSEEEGVVSVLLVTGKEAWSPHLNVTVKEAWPYN